MLILSRLALNRFRRICKYLIVRLLTLIYYCKRLRISVFWRSSNFEHFAPPLPREARTDPKRPSVGAEQWAGSIGRAAQWLDNVAGTRCGVLWCSYDLCTASVRAVVCCGARMTSTQRRYGAMVQCFGMVWCSYDLYTASVWRSYDLYTASVWRNGSMLWHGVVSASVSHNPTRMHGGMGRETLGHCSIASLLLFTK